MRTAHAAAPWSVRLIALLLSLACAPWVRAGTIKRLYTPTPLTSADLERIVKEAALPDTERPAIDAAFDAYVDGWQRLRDGTLRPLRNEVDAFRPLRLTWGPNLPPDDAGRLAALQPRIRQAYTRLSQLDDTFFAALRAGSRTPEQLQAIESAQCDAATALAAAMIRSNGLEGTAGMLYQLRAMPAGLDEPTAKAFNERAARLRRESLPLLKRVANEAMREGDRSAVRCEDARKLTALRLKAFDDLAALMPPAVGADWLDRQRQKMVRKDAWNAAVLHGVAYEVLGDRCDEIARKRVEKWIAARRAIEDQLLLDPGWVGDSLDDEANARKIALIKSLDQIDTDALAEIGKGVHIDDFERQLAKAHPVFDGKDKEGSDIASEWGDPDLPSQVRTRRMAAHNATDESGEAKGGGMPVASPRGMGRVRVDRTRDALGVTEAQRATWDALANDLLEATDALQAEKGLKGAFGSDGPDQALADLDRVREHREALRALEERWFDSIAAALPDLSRDSLVEVRSRRSIDRMIDGAVTARGMLAALGNNTVVDIDAAVDRLAPDVRPRIAADLASSRKRRIAELQEMIDIADRTVREIFVMYKQGGDKPGPEWKEKYDRFMQDTVDKLNALAKRSARETKDELETMASHLDGPAGDPLRRAVRRDAYPEVFRDLDRTDRTLDRAISLPGLTPAQTAAIADAGEAFRIRSEALADRGTAIVDATGPAFQAMQREEKSGDVARNAVLQQAYASIERAFDDNVYDRSELAAQLMRRLRAQLTPAQAKRIGLAAP